jgi:hypothetical protein
MTITYTWLIDQLDTKPQEDGKTDVVVDACWRCNGTDGTYNASLYGITHFPLSQSGSFTPYNQLTKDQVLGWCYENGVNKADIEAAVAVQINQQVNPPIVTLPLPFAE